MHSLVHRLRELRIDRAPPLALASAADGASGHPSPCWQGEGTRGGGRREAPSVSSFLSGPRTAVTASPARPRFPQIGRASCRERVCQYGVDLGGRRTIKKKKKEKPN